LKKAPEPRSRCGTATLSYLSHDLPAEKKQRSASILKLIQAVRRLKALQPGGTLAVWIFK
jgi:hypothetical protein